MASFIGISGVAFRAKDPRALHQWYCDMLGITPTKYGTINFTVGANYMPDGLDWIPGPESSRFFAPTQSAVMFCFWVDNLDGFLKKLALKGIIPFDRDDSHKEGIYAWIRDPEGNAVELCEPR